MGVIQREPSFDAKYSQEIIARARELSPEIDEYIITQRYLVETPEENLTPEWLRNRVLIMTIEQLGMLGIFVNQSADSILDQPLFIDAVLTLRSKFDPDRLYSFLSKHQTIRDEISQLIDDDCIEDVVRCCSRLLPLDEGWESIVNLLDNRPSMLRSTGVFNTKLTEVLDRCDRLGDDPMFSDDDTERMLGYAKFLADRKTKICDIAASIYSTNVAGEKSQEKMEIVASSMKYFESQLSRPETIRQFIDGEFSPNSFIEKIRSFYVSKWRHCLEFYLAQENTNDVDPRYFPSDLEAAIMVATLYVDAPDKTHARVFVLETFENSADQLAGRYTKFRDIIDKAMSNLVVVEGEVNYAIIK